jgi:hypothetical protein
MGTNPDDHLFHAGTGLPTGRNEGIRVNLTLSAAMRPAASLMGTQGLPGSVPLLSQEPRQFNRPVVGLNLLQV